jgi:hypothetical protein
MCLLPFFHRGSAGFGGGGVAGACAEIGSWGIERGRPWMMPPFARWSEVGRFARPAGWIYGWAVRTGSDGASGSGARTPGLLEQRGSTPLQVWARPACSHYQTWLRRREGPIVNAISLAGTLPPPPAFVPCFAHSPPPQRNKRTARRRDGSDDRTSTRYTTPPCVPALKNTMHVGPIGGPRPRMCALLRTSPRHGPSELLAPNARPMLGTGPGPGSTS